MNKEARGIYAKAAFEFTAYIIRGTIGKTIEISAPKCHDYL